MSQQYKALKLIYSRTKVSIETAENRKKTWYVVTRHFLDHITIKKASWMHHNRKCFVLTTRTSLSLPSKIIAMIYTFLLQIFFPAFFFSYTWFFSYANQPPSHVSWDRSANRKKKRSFFWNRNFGSDLIELSCNNSKKPSYKFEKKLTNKNKLINNTDMIYQFISSEKISLSVLERIENIYICVF